MDLEKRDLHSTHSIVHKMSNDMDRIYMLIILIYLNLNDTRANGALTVLVRDSAPFTLRNNGIYNGIEVQLVEAIAKELNFDINYILNTDTSQRDDIGYFNLAASYFINNVLFNFIYSLYK